MLWPHRILLHRVLQGSVGLLLAGLLVGALLLAAAPPTAQVLSERPGLSAPAVQAEAVPELSAQALKVVWEGIDPDRPSRLPRPAIKKPVAQPKPKADTPNVKLCGVIFSSAGDSVAFVEHQALVAPVRVGHSFDGWRLSVIGPVSAVFSKGRRKHVLTMETEYGDYSVPAARDTGRPDRGRSAAVARPGAMRGSNRPGLRQIGSERRPALAPVPPPLNGADARVAVSRRVIDRYRDDPSKAIAEQNLRIEPHLQNGRMAGVTLRRVPPGSLPASYGLMSGDKIVAVNGKPLNSAAAIMQLYSKHRNSESVRVTIERGGQRKEVLFYAR